MSTAVDPSAPHQCGTIEVLPRSPRGRAANDKGRAERDARAAPLGQRHLQRGALSATLLPRMALGGTVSLQLKVVQCSVLILTLCHPGACQ